MRSARGRLSASRRQTGSDPVAQTSSIRPSVRSLRTSFCAAPPFRLGASSMPPVLPLRGGRKQHELGIGELHRDPPSACDGTNAVTTEAPHGRECRRGRIPDQPSGAGAATPITALFAEESQCSLDNVMAKIGACGSCHDHQARRGLQSHSPAASAIRLRAYVLADKSWP
jgi:hypothetical protein